MLQPQATFIGQQALDAAGQALPLLSLTFYQHAIILQRLSGPDKGTEFPVDPAAVAQALAAKIEFSTGLLNPNTVYVGQSGVKRKVVEYRPPQVTAIWLEGLIDPIRLPLPGLVMTRVTSDGRNPSYKIHAVKERPAAEEAELFTAPLPNTSSNGTCWGTVSYPSPEELKGTALTRDWEQFMGSRFGNHALGNKSKAFPRDLREQYKALDRTETYPLDDLLEAGSGAKILADLLEW